MGSSVPSESIVEHLKISLILAKISIYDMTKHSSGGFSQLVVQESDIA